MQLGFGIAEWPVWPTLPRKHINGEARSQLEAHIFEDQILDFILALDSSNIVGSHISFRSEYLQWSESKKFHVPEKGPTALQYKFLFFLHQHFRNIVWIAEIALALSKYLEKNYIS